MREPKTIDVLLLILLGAIWGSAFFNIKIATYPYDPITLVFVRIFFALMALGIYCIYRNVKILAFSKNWKIYALVMNKPILVFQIENYDHTIKV